MNPDRLLPPGQREIFTFPRFGLTRFARRFPYETDRIRIDVIGDVEQPLRLSDPFGALKPVVQVADFHCVTTWTKRNVSWGGVRCKDFFNDIVAVDARPRKNATFVVFGCQDGYEVGMQLEDLMAPDVMLATTHAGAPLSVAHGAPLRLVAPSHYAYKSAKHISKIEFRSEERTYRAAAFEFMDHPRARVELEERGRLFPGWLLRWLYRPLIGMTIRRFATALRNHRE